MNTDPKVLARALGHQFTDASLLRRALTHRSLANTGDVPAEHNERLEFLGDSVLGFLISDALYRRFPDYPEGTLTKLKSFLVSGKNLAAVGERLDIGSYLLLGKGEEASGGRSKKSLIVNAVEALIAAVYLDGGIDSARSVIEVLIIGETALAKVVENLDNGSPKSALQEWAQAQKLDVPRYRVLSESGPVHRRTFTVEVRVGLEFHAAAEGSSKKEAESHAAAKALVCLQAQESIGESPRHTPQQQKPL